MLRARQMKQAKQGLKNVNSMQTRSRVRPCSMTAWSAWSPPSATCGTISLSRRRQCSSEGRICTRTDCHGNVVEHQEKHLEPCCSWSSWGQWWTHSTARKRSRACMCGSLVELHISKCGGVDQEVQQKSCLWSDWGPWSHSCDSCGSGSLSRFRHCYGDTDTDSEGRHNLREYSYMQIMVYILLTHSMIDPQPLLTQLTT